MLSFIRNVNGKPETREAQFAHAEFLGRADFRGSVFSEHADFKYTTFEAGAEFDNVEFKGGATFYSSKFLTHTSFDRVKFHGSVTFALTTFTERVDFSGATFETLANFPECEFLTDSHFFGARFKHYASFASCLFGGKVDYTLAKFDGHADFSRTRFEDTATLRSVTFRSRANFDTADFAGDVDLSSIFNDEAYFVSARFGGEVSLEGSLFRHNLHLVGAEFVASSTLGPFMCAGSIKLSGAKFSSPVTIMASTYRVEAQRTRWGSTASLRLRNAQVNLSGAVFEFPFTILTEHDNFSLPDGRSLPDVSSSSGSRVAVESIRGVDAAHLLLSDVDLSRCLFAGTVHLDQVRLEGDCRFDTAPDGLYWHKGRPTRFTPRHVLAEEHSWRASRASTIRGWNFAVLGTGRNGPAQLAPVYRALRKSYEDNKNEPGAADFYYGEMEMRRHATATPRAERYLLTSYWALSGYGLRALRATIWLIAAMSTTLLSLMLWGLPMDDPKQTSSGKITGVHVRLTTNTPDPVNPKGPPLERLTSERFEKSLRVVVNSVIFRSSGQDLTTAGTYLEMLSRLSEPILLGFAVLAIRGRVKR
ncbi:pentapeptide repeat-containing protein [Streptomyces griseoincarnatus]|uniref:pentapeptide repeat-containing protein n=1 Tax=Streptomyces variabilis TaxID=67372 RepID=UPI001FEC6983|nr:pentapeptide repeat-containing protein [Streptomyces variabilis]